MKLKQLFVLSVLAVGVQGAAQAAYPADAEWSMVAVFASEQAASWGVSARAVTPHDPFPFGGGSISD
jgi:hypothetical protein